MRRIILIFSVLFIGFNSFGQEKNTFNYLQNLVILGQMASLYESQINLVILCDIYEYEPSLDQKEDYVYSKYLSDYYLDWATSFIGIVKKNVPDGSIILLDRRNISTTLDEIELQNSGTISDRTKIKIGQMLGANIILNIRGYIINSTSASMSRITYTLISINTNEVLSSDLNIITTKDGITTNMLNGVLQELN